jgi:hypothetical protein
MSHCQACELAIATHKCSICNSPFCEEHAKEHLKFWIIDNPDTKMIKLEDTPDAKTL